MKTKNRILPFLTLLLTFICIYFGCNNSPTAGSGSETQNALVTGYLYKSGAPAVGAKVYFVRVNYNPRTGALEKSFANADTVITNSTGKYGTSDLDTGSYNIFGKGTDGTLSLLDSVRITGDSQVVPPDTLKLPGSLTGIIKMQGTDDPRTVFVIPLGTNGFVSTGQSGSFSLSNMAEGQYSVRFLSILDRYLPLDTTFTVTAGQALTLPDSIRLPLKIPTPTGFKISYDTLKQIVTLSWNRADAARVKGYNVYRQHLDSAEVKLNALARSDTFYVDSTGRQDQAYIYSVVGVDFENKEGIRTAGERVLITTGFVLVRTIGTSGTGENQYSRPYGISISDNDMIMIADYDSGKVLIYDTVGSFIRNYKGFNSPLNVVYAEGDNFYVVEKNSRLIKLVNSSGSIISQFGGTGIQNGSFTDISPCFFIRKNNALYIPDYGGNRLQIFDSIGTYLKSFTMPAPWSISLISSSTLAIGSDATLSIVDTAGIKETEWAGVYAFTSSTTKNGNLVIATHEQEGPLSIWKIAFYSPTGNLVGVFGVSNSNSPFFFGQLRGLAIDSKNNLYVADSWSKTVKVFGLPSNL